MQDYAEVEIWVPKLQAQKTQGGLCSLNKIPWLLVQRRQTTVQCSSFKVMCNFVHQIPSPMMLLGHWSLEKERSFELLSPAPSGHLTHQHPFSWMPSVKNS